MHIAPHSLLRCLAGPARPSGSPWTDITVRRPPGPGRRGAILAALLLPCASAACATGHGTAGATGGGGGGAAAVGGGGFSATTTGNSGGGPGVSSSSGSLCVDPEADCPKSATACIVPTCAMGSCATESASPGTPCADNAGDVCDGAGHCVACNTAADCPTQATSCIVSTCSNHACGTMNASPGATCANSGGSVCDGAGTCVPCNDDVDCAGYPMLVCAGHQCVGATCSDAKKDGNETGVDCGGGACPACAAGEGCAQPSDCQSGVCTASVCQAPSCADGAKNGTEIAVDCGGGACPGCADGTSCTGPSDCLSGYCNAGASCAPCGGLGEGCCPGSSCDAATLVCLDSPVVNPNPQICLCGSLHPGMHLGSGQSLWSCDGRFILAMQGDGNLVLYWNGVGVLWSTDTIGSSANVATFQTDGSLVVSEPGGPVWSSYSPGGDTLALQDDGNLVIYQAGSPLWASNTCCH